MGGCSIGACQSGYCTEQQLRAVQAAADPITDGGTQSVALPVEQAVVTALKPLVIGADPNDAPGFFVQAGQAGLFVETTMVSPAAAVGDRVSFGVTRVSKERGQRRAKSVIGYQRLSTNAPLPATLDVTALDLTQPAVRSANESVLARIPGRLALASTFDGGTQGYGEVSFITPPTATTVRLPASLNLTEDLRDGCSVAASGPLWLSPAGGAVSTWSAAALTGTLCPPPQLLALRSPTSTTLELTTSRYMAPALPTNFVLRVRGDPQALAITQVSSLAPQRLQLQAALQPGWEYELTTSTTPPLDTRGRPVASGPLLNAVAGGCQSMEPVVISGIWYSSTLAGSFIELHNRSSAPINLGTLNYRLLVRTSSGGNTRSLTGTIQPGAYFQVADGFSLTADDNWSGMNLASSSLVALGIGINNSCNPNNAVDVVLFGNTSCGAGPLPSLNAGDALRRVDAAGCVKTNTVAADFVRLTNPPAPRSSSTPAVSCLCP